MASYHCSVTKHLFSENLFEQKHYWELPLRIAKLSIVLNSFLAPLELFDPGLHSLWEFEELVLLLLCNLAARYSAIVLSWGCDATEWCEDTLARLWVDPFRGKLRCEEPSLLSGCGGVGSFVYCICWERDDIIGALGGKSVLILSFPFMWYPFWEASLLNENWLSSGNRVDPLCMVCLFTIWAFELVLSPLIRWFFSSVSLASDNASVNSKRSSHSRRTVSCKLFT